MRLTDKAADIMRLPRYECAADGVTRRTASGMNKHYVKAHTHKGGPVPAAPPPRPARAPSRSARSGRSRLWLRSPV